MLARASRIRARFFWTAHHPGKRPSRFSQPIPLRKNGRKTFVDGVIQPRIFIYKPFDVSGVISVQRVRGVSFIVHGPAV